MIRCLVPDLPTWPELAPWLARIDENRWYTNSGPLVREFESRLAGFVGDGAHCVTLSSGMSALELGLQALGIGPGSRVLMPAVTFPATALAVQRAGAQPLFADVCARSWMLTPALARQAAKHERVDLVMPVAAFGHPLPAPDWDAFVAETGIGVLADAAAAFGTQRIGARVHWAFSLHATKPMGIGEGGLFVSHDGTLVEQVRRLANFGFEHYVVGRRGGTNAKLSEYGAAVGLAQLQRWPQLVARRASVLRDYRERLAPLAGVALQDGLQAPPATFCVSLPADAAEVAAALAEAGIETRRWYLPPLYEHPAFREVRRIGPDGGDALPASEQLARSLLGLPFHTRLSADEVQRVVETLAMALETKIPARPPACSAADGN